MSVLKIGLAMVLFSSATWAGSTFQNLDADGDGQISMDEAMKQPQLTRDFSAIDKNQDGMLDAAEFARFEAATTPERKQEQEKRMYEEKGDME